MIDTRRPDKIDSALDAAKYIDSGAPLDDATNVEESLAIRKVQESLIVTVVDIHPDSRKRMYDLLPGSNSKPDNTLE